MTPMPTLRRLSELIDKYLGEFSEPTIGQPPYKRKGAVFAKNFGVVKLNANFDRAAKLRQDGDRALMCSVGGFVWIEVSRKLL